MLSSMSAAAVTKRFWVALTLSTLPFVVDRMGFCIKSNAVSQSSSNLSSEEYRLHFQIKRRDVSPSPTLWWASCSAKRQYGVLNYVMTCVLGVIRRSFTHHKVSPESPNFTLTSMPTFSTATLGMTSLATSVRKLSRQTIENVASNGFEWNFSRMA